VDWSVYCGESPEVVAAMEAGRMVVVGVEAGRVMVDEAWGEASAKGREKVRRVRRVVGRESVNRWCMVRRGVRQE
jgi:hypothetical protein